MTNGSASVSVFVETATKKNEIRISNVRAYLASKVRIVLHYIINSVGSEQKREKQTQSRKIIQQIDIMVERITFRKMSFSPLPLRSISVITIRLLQRCRAEFHRFAK